MTDFNFIKKDFKLINGIVSFKINNLETKKVTEFYQNAPFPNYKKNDNKISIEEKGNKNFLAAQFKKFIGYKKKILEVGCGTGQLSIFFSIGTNNKVVGLDATIHSLNLGKNFADKNNISNIRFINADIFDDILMENYFDFIWCNGVLHHTKDPHGAFKILIKSLKSKGYVLVGLYNKYGRLRTFIRRLIYKLLGNKTIKILDPTLKNLKLNDQEKDAWIRDQYLHPIESSHTLDEVLNWFKMNNIDFISSVPSCDFDYNYQNIFEKKSIGSLYSRIINQISMIFNSLGSDGGLFIVIGQKQ